ncbi:hypothetical protein [Vibrio sp. 10N.261.55.A7]|uniref:hypothetical protein n=1 Tax=Vibrio sp. 10N.261.55.A7 TaxID=1880851 RepID=UPI000C83C44E|nr:hypothetical protein [Vibrio sp. 10N.261.55.A7]PMK05025.1 hypothetical protein BCU12_02040 [Vibrio sp. 10N.261.55.A7]
MKILLVNYHYHPSKTVAAARVSFWAKTLSKKHEVYVLTNEKSCAAQYDEKVKCIGHIFKSFPSSINFFWGFNILYSLLTNIRRYDCILLSGSPFLYFWVTPILRLFSKKIILDYRDPYAQNPLHPKGRIINYVRSTFEKIVNFCATDVITVNRVCANLIYAKDVKVIDNGFDNTQFDIVNEKYIDYDSPISFFYGGKFSTSRSIEPLLRYLGEKAKLNLYSPDSISHPHINNYGLVSYKEFIENAMQYDIAILLVAGFDFESTTKLFDYMAMRKPIVIISATGKVSSVMLEYLSDYPFLLWNSEMDFGHSLQNLLHAHNRFIYEEFDVSRYSRTSTTKLLELLIES